MTPMMPLLVLASASPRRTELLAQIGVPHVVRPADVDESRHAGEPPFAYVARVTADKAAAGWLRSEGLPVLAADTAVVLGEELFAKPRDQREGLAMLSALSGKTHRVLTAVALQTHAGLSAVVSQTEVTFRELSDAEKMWYWTTGEPLGKAGGYAVQGLAAAFISRIEGSYSGVMGLPLAETAGLLKAAGISIWQTGATA
jgi:septum formation protein